MTLGTSSDNANPRPARQWRAKTARSVLQLLGTVAAYVLLAGASYDRLAVSLPLGLLLAVLAGVVMVRIFILQHDCAHRSLFLRPKTNDRVGTALGLLTLAPHAYWRAMHLVHHGTSGDLDRRGHGDIVTVTADEYRAMKPLVRLRYRLYRHPVTLLGLGPILQFMVRFRLPGIIPRERRKERQSIALTNLALLAMHGLFAVHGDFTRWLVMHLVITQVAAGLGIWLFFAQHQVEEPYWVRHGQWSLRSSALKGSSHLLLPRLLEWTFGWINLHHVHHLDPTVPNYLLKGYMEQRGLGGAGVRLGALDSLRAFRLKVYDEATGRMTGFPSLQGQDMTSPLEERLIAPPSTLNSLFTLSGEGHRNV